MPRVLAIRMCAVSLALAGSWLANTFSRRGNRQPSRRSCASGRSGSRALPFRQNTAEAGRGTIHTGDLFVRGTPFIDYSSGVRAIEWTKTLAEILTMDFQTVIPGHGQISRRDDALAFRKTFETIRDLRREKKAPEQAAKLLRVDDLGWQPGPLFERSLPGLYDEVR